MSRAVPLVLVLVLLSAAVFLAGCPKKAVDSTLPTGPGAAPGATPPGPAAEAPAAGGGGAGQLAEVSKRRAQLKSYALTVTTPEGKAMKQWMKQENGKPVAMKMQFEAGGQKGYMLMLLDKKEMYMVNEQENTALKMSDMKEDTPDGATSGFGDRSGIPTLDNLEKGNPNISADKVDGVDCWKVDSPAMAGVKSTMWIDKKYGLPVQSETNGKLTKFEYEQVNDVPDSEFMLPAGIKIMDMGEQLKGMADKLPKPPGE